MRMALTIAALLLPITAEAQSVRVAMGEEVSFTLKDGAASGERRAAAVPNGFETKAGQMLAGIKPPEAPVTQGMPMHEDVGQPPAAAPGTVRFRFVAVAGTNHALLAIYNGYPQALIYRARIWVKGKASPTDVCLVMPGKAGVEHWPYAIEAVEVGAFALVDWKPADGVPCK